MRKLPLLQLYIRAKSFNRGIMAPSLIKLYLYSFIPFRLVIYGAQNETYIED